MRSVSDAQVSCAERGEKITGGCFSQIEMVRLDKTDILLDRGTWAE
jgi:hypothetical protein